jgi:hypothetical protein
LEGETKMQISVISSGSVILLHAHDQAAKLWIEENCQPEPWQWLGDSLGVEPRYVEPMLNGFVADGGELL